MYFNFSVHDFQDATFPCFSFQLKMNIFLTNIYARTIFFSVFSFVGKTFFFVKLWHTRSLGKQSHLNNPQHSYFHTFRFLTVVKCDYYSKAFRTNKCVRLKVEYFSWKDKKWEWTTEKSQKRKSRKNHSTSDTMKGFTHKFTSGLWDFVEKSIAESWFEGRKHRRGQ